MKLVTHSKVLITGLHGFTGTHLGRYLAERGFCVFGLKSDLTDREAVITEVTQLAPDYVIHLGGVSFAVHSNIEQIYRVNVIGSANLLDALLHFKGRVAKVILASSAAVYGSFSRSVLSESLCPKPVSHYGCSKLAMENIAQNYMDSLPILITRPFNYTGIGQAEHFLVPKIIKAYKDHNVFLELGNLNISREFNDVRDVCHTYHLLLTSEKLSTPVNICSGNSVSLFRIIELMEKITGYEINVRVNRALIRANDISRLSGCTERLLALTGSRFSFQIEDTLRWMYEEKLQFSQEPRTI